MDYLILTTKNEVIEFKDYTEVIPWLSKHGYRLPNMGDDQCDIFETENKKGEKAILEWHWRDN